jgi:sugar lactone lactonase YvrE
VTVLARTDAHEGPVFVEAEQALYFTTSRPRVQIRRLDLRTGAVTTVRAEANVANGMTLGPCGELLVCEQGTLTEPAAISRVARSGGTREVLVDAWEGLPLNSPNDLVVASDNSIWFTDPSYGHLQGFRPESARGPRRSPTRSTPAGARRAAGSPRARPSSGAGRPHAQRCRRSPRSPRCAPPHLRGASGPSGASLRATATPGTVRRG